MTSGFDETPTLEVTSRVSVYFLSKLCNTNGEKGDTGPPKKTLSLLRIYSKSLSGSMEKSFKFILTLLFMTIPKEPSESFLQRYIKEFLK